MTRAQQKRLEQAQMRVLFHVPFFSNGIARLPVILDPNVRTAQTDGKEIRWNPGFFDWLSDACLVTVLCHEVCHCMLGHLWRIPPGGCWDKWNQATDHAVNLMLKAFSKLCKKDPFPFPEPETCYLADPQYAGMSEEAIYFKLPDPPKMPQDGLGGYNGRGGGLIVAGAPSGKQGNSSFPPPAGSEPHSMPGFGEMTQPAAGAQADQNRLKNEWDGILLQALEIARSRGDVPGELSRYVDGLIKPVVPWWELLRSFLREQCADDWNFSAPAMEYSDSGFMLPSLKSEKMGPIVFGSDWSGSTFGALVEKFHVEKQSALDTLHPSKLVDIGFDTRVVFEREYMPGDTIERKILGGGGTSFKDFFRRCAEMEPAPKCAVILTDLDGEMPDPPDYPAFPVLWVVFEKGCSAPFGEVIVAE